MASSARQLLAPYLAGSAVRPNGDQDMHCPLHEDARRSATINFRTNEWYCHACEMGGTLRKLLARRRSWLSPNVQTAAAEQSSDKRPLPDSARLDGWHSALLASPDRLEFLEVKRGITQETIQRHNIGWDGSRYTIPVFDETGRLKNIRQYSPVLEPKMLNWRGHGTPRLFPISIMIDDPDEVMLCEGELDALLANQSGMPTLTGTGGVKSTGRWRPNWNDWFSERVVFICFDRDRDGLNAQRKVAEALTGVAKEIHLIELPYPMGSRKDLTDYFIDGGDVKELMHYSSRVRAEEARDKSVIEKVAYEDLRSGKMESKTVEIEGTLSSIFGTQLMLPMAVKGSCSCDWDPKRCSTCPVGHVGGNLTKKIPEASDLHLEILTTSSVKQREQLLRQALGAPSKCPVVEVSPEYYSAWDCEIRNGSNLAEEAYPVILRHEGKPPQLNRTYKFRGKLRVAPRGQRAIFMASRCVPAMQDIDSFKPQPKQIEAAREWTNSLAKEPVDRIEQIAETLEYHCTEIYGQRLLHIAMDMVYHSVLRFQFGGSVITRGWMECLAIGETRSGKSTAIQRLLELYGRGHYQSAENTSIPGMLYGIERRGGARATEWGGTIGVLPLNNRGLVAIDEAQGLSTDQIGQLSDMRSRGVVQISKIRAVEVDAKVRLIWAGNSRRDTYAHGIEALRDQMGQAEDLARIDLPIFVLEDIGEVERKKAQQQWGKLPWPEEVLQWIVLWTWSRKPDHVKWSRQAINAIWKESAKLSKTFATKIPIFQPNEAGVRLARLAVAIAARLFSSKDGHELNVLTSHVHAAAKLYERFLGAIELGIVDIHEREAIVNEAENEFGVEMRHFLKTIPMHARQQIMTGNVDTNLFSRLDPGGTYLAKMSGMHAVDIVGGRMLVADWAVKMAKEVK